MDRTFPEHVFLVSSANRWLLPGLREVPLSWVTRGLPWNINTPACTLLDLYNEMSLSYYLLIT